MIVIDPGANGGLVYPNYAKAHPYELIAVKMPGTDREIINHIEAAAFSKAPPVAYLEDLVKFAGRNMPSSAMATYASNWGFIKGACAALNFRLVLVPPKKWQAALGLGGSKSHASKTAWKNHLKNRAEQLFPNVKVTLANCDALLMFEAATKNLI